MEQTILEQLIKENAALLRVAKAAEYVCSLRPEPLPNAGIPELKEALKALPPEIPK